jgi:hypothetical protein
MLCISQLINATIDSFNSIVAKDGIMLNLGGLDGLNSLLAYYEKWHMQLWNLAFPTVFKGVSPFKKSNVITDYRKVILLVKRVISGEPSSIFYSNFSF